MAFTEESFSQGLEAYKAEQFNEAEAAFLKVLEMEPYSSEALLNLGNVYFKLKDWDKTEQTWLKTINTNPLEDKAYLNLGNLYFSKGQNSKAVYHWEIFSKLHPTHRDVHKNMGLAYEAMGQLYQAHNAYKVYLSLQAEGKDSMYLRRRMAEAQKIAEHNLAQAEKLMQAGQMEQAKEAYEGCVTVCPVHPKVYKHYAAVLYQLNAFPTALKWYEIAHTLLPEDTGILINLGVLYEKLDKPFFALWSYDAAIQLDANKISGKVKKRFEVLWREHGAKLLDGVRQEAQATINEGDYKAAEKITQRLCDFATRYAADKLGSINELREFLAGRRDPKTQAAKTAYTMAEEFREAGQYDRALMFYDRYLEILPTGDKAAEVQAKRDQIAKAISAIIGTLLGGAKSEEDSSQSVA